jgi:putative ABC transport system ATP-binding protein
MECHSCGQTNAPGATGCSRCGQPLGVYRSAAVAVGGGGHSPGGAGAAPNDGMELVFLGAPSAGTRVPLGAATAFTLGRGPECTAVVDHPSVSRLHARIQRHDGAYWVEDLGSRNGTWVNDQAVNAPQPLRDGDVLRLGDVDLRVALPKPRTPSGDYLTLADGQLLPLGGTDLYIGRAPTNAIVLDDLTISRQHARLQRLPQGWLLTDLESSNGTMVNEQPLSGPVFVHSGDAILLGRVGLTFHEGGSSTPGEARTMVVRREGKELVVDSQPRLPPMVAQPRAGPPLITMQNVLKTYVTPAGPLTVLKSVSLSIQPGEFVAIVGPSGCGKSTMLNVITGIDRPDSGQVTIHGQDVLRLGTDTLARWRGRNVGIVFQFFQLLPTLTVAENVMLPMAFCNTFKGRARRARAMEVLRLVGMDHVADRLPSALSGGQQQRIAIARALANDPPLLVGDEPTGNLDSQTSQQMFELFASLVAGGKTMLMVTHDPVLARSVPRRIEMLDGAIVQQM